jgi:hypothetical protein
MISRATTRSVRLWYCLSCRRSGVVQFGVGDGETAIAIGIVAAHCMRSPCPCTARPQALQPDGWYGVIADAERKPPARETKATGKSGKRSRTAR